VVFLGPRLGSGLEALAKALAGDLADLAEEERGADLLDLAEWHESRFGRERLLARAREALPPASAAADRLHDRLAGLGAREIITVGWDGVTERALARVGRPAHVLVPDLTMTFGPTGPLPLLKLHGDVAAGPERLVLTRQDDEQYGRRFPPVRRHLDELAATSTFLFLGTGLKDAGFARVWGAVGEALREVGRASYAVMARPSPRVVDQWKARRVEVLTLEGAGEGEAGAGGAEAGAELLRFLDELGRRAEAKRGGPALSAEALDRVPYEEAWRTFVWKRFRYAETAGLFQFQRTVYRRDVERREIYVEPTVRPQREERERGCPACGRLGRVDPAEGPVCRTTGCPREGKLIPELGPVTAAAVKLRELVRPGARVVVLGAPGVGKTSLLMWLAHELSRPEGDGLGIVGERPLPLFVKLRDYARAIEGDAGATLAGYVGEHVRQQVSDAPDGVVRRWLEEGRVAFLFDGFDEVPSGMRGRIGEDVKRYLEGVNQCAAVLSSRPAGYQMAPLGMPFEVHGIEELGDKEVGEFLGKWFGVTARWDGKEAEDAVAEAASLKQSLDQRPDLARLAGNPLMLTLIVLVNRAGSSLPQRRAEFYDSALKTLGKTWEDAKGLDPERRDIDSVMRTLGRVAYRLHRTQQDREISGERLVKWIAASFREDKLVGEADAERQARAFLKMVEERVGVLVETGPGIFGFVHLGFQEYLAAWHLGKTASKAERSEVVNRFLHEPRWYEPLRLMISSLPSDDATAAMRQILEEPSPYEALLHRDLAFAGWCLTDAPSVDGRVQDVVVERLKDLDVGPILAQIAGSRPRGAFNHLDQWLLSYLEQPSHFARDTLAAVRARDLFVEAATRLLSRSNSTPYQDPRPDVAILCRQRSYDPDVLVPGWFSVMLREAPEGYVNSRLTTLAEDGYEPAIKMAKELICSGKSPGDLLLDALNGVPRDEELIRRAAATPSRAAYDFLAVQEPRLLIEAIKRQHPDVALLLTALGRAEVFSNNLVDLALGVVRQGAPEARKSALVFLMHSGRIDSGRWREEARSFVLSNRSTEAFRLLFHDAPDRIPPDASVLDLLHDRFCDPERKKLPWHDNRHYNDLLLPGFDSPWDYLRRWHVDDPRFIEYATEHESDDHRALLWLHSIGEPIEPLVEELISPLGVPLSLVFSDDLARMLGDLTKRSARMRRLILAKAQEPEYRFIALRALALCAPGRTPYLTDATLLDAASIPSPADPGPGVPHRAHWLPILASTAQVTPLRRFDAWLTLIKQRPPLTSHARHADFEDRPARISLLGEAILRALGDRVRANLADLVAAAYAYQLDHGVRVLTTAEDLHADDRAALATALDLPASRQVALDLMHILGTEAAQELNAPPSVTKEYGFRLFALLRHAWKLPPTTSNILLAFANPAAPVRLTAGDPLPGLFLISEAVQLWKRPLQRGDETLFELPEIELEGLQEGGPDGTYSLDSRLTFRLDYRYNDETLEKTRFDGTLVSRNLHTALDRLRIACDAFPDVVVELLLPTGTETIEVLREAESKTTSAPSASPADTPTARRPGTWEAIAPGLKPPGDVEAIARLASVFNLLAPEDQTAARQSLAKLLGPGKRAPDVREKAARVLVEQFYDDRTDEGRILAFEALFGWATRKGTKGAAWEKAMAALLAVYGGLPLAAEAKLVAYLEQEQEAGKVPEALAVLWKGVLGRHARRGKLRVRR
jgi:hypothetical protein